MEILKKFENPIGMSLMEVIVALAVIVTGVISGLTLTVYNLNASVASETKLIASNLAREGIEVIRQIRDSNWLSGSGWNQGIVDEGSYRLTINFDSVNNEWITVTQDVGIDNCADCLLYLDLDTGVYSHNTEGVQTSYRRLITLREICWQEILSQEVVLDDNEECSDSALELAGIEVESLVKWMEFGGQQQTTVIDRLYDWR